MLTNEIQGESRIEENSMYGLVCEVKPMRHRRRGFTLIERTPSKGRDYLYVASTYPANFPIRAGSLICALAGRPA